MCERYPNCLHAGPLIDRIDGIDRHCETIKPNHECMYLRLGCKGCTWKGMPNPPILDRFSSQILVRLVVGNLVQYRTAIEIADNLLIRTQRQMIYNRLCAYINKRIEDGTESTTR